MAHNFQRYDSYFILQYLGEQGVKYDVIMRGAKALSVKVPMFNITFIDSLNSTPMRLANFPKTFGIEELAKGYFPHLFNKKENENYVGPIPPTPYYTPNGMRSIFGMAQEYVRSRLRLQLSRRDCRLLLIGCGHFTLVLYGVSRSISRDYRY